MTLLTVLTSFRTNNLKGLGATLTLQAIVNAEDRLGDFPEDVTDEFKQALKLLKDSWIHISALACPNSSAINQEKPKERICAPFS